MPSDFERLLGDVPATFPRPADTATKIQLLSCPPMRKSNSHTCTFQHAKPAIAPTSAMK